MPIGSISLRMEHVPAETIGDSIFVMSTSRVCSSISGKVASNSIFEEWNMFHKDLQRMPSFWIFTMDSFKPLVLLCKLGV